MKTSNLGVPNFIGAKLEEARKARGYTMRALGEVTEISHQAISSFEKNRKKPSLETLNKFSQKLRFPLDFFTDDSDFCLLEDFQTKIFYRSLKSVGKTARSSASIKYRWIRKIFMYLSDFVDFPQVDLPNIKVPSDPVELSLNEIEEIAEKTRRYWGLGDGPIADVTNLLESKGVIVARYELDEDGLDAFSQWVDYRPFIVLSSNKKCAVRSRFDAAHELGHLIMHKNIPERYLSKQDDFFLFLEKQAHRFAGAFLFPQKSFADETIAISLDLLITLKPRWKMSIASMLKRAEDLDFISSHEFSQLRRNYGRRGWVKREPLDNQLEVEKPKALRNALELIVQNDIQSTEEVLNEIKLSSYEIEVLAGLTPNYLSNKPADVVFLKTRQKVEGQNNRVEKEREFSQNPEGEIVRFPQK